MRKLAIICGYALTLFCVSGWLGCSRDDRDETIWNANMEIMRRLEGDVSQVQFESKSSDFTEILAVARRASPNDFKMYGFDSEFRFNPSVSNLTNNSASNEIAVVEVVMLKHNGKSSYLGMDYNMKPVELEQLPRWAGEK